MNKATAALLHSCAVNGAEIGLVSPQSGWGADPDDWEVTHGIRFDCEADVMDVLVNSGFEMGKKEGHDDFDVIMHDLGHLCKSPNPKGVVLW